MLLLPSEISLGHLDTGTGVPILTTSIPHSHAESSLPVIVIVSREGKDRAPFLDRGLPRPGQRDWPLLRRSGGLPLEAVLALGLLLARRDPRPRQRLLELPVGGLQLQGALIPFHRLGGGGIPSSLNLDAPAGACQAGGEQKNRQPAHITPPPHTRTWSSWPV